MPAATTAGWSARAAAPANAQHSQQAAASPLARLAAVLSSSNSGSGSGSVPGQKHMTLRKVMKILRRHVVLGLSLPDAVVSLLAPRMPHGSSTAQQLQQQLRDLGGEFASVVLPSPSDFSLTSLSPANGVRFAVGPSCYVDVPGADLTRIQQHGQLPAVLMAGLVQVAFAVAAGEPVMLLGPTCFKSKLMAMWAELMGLEEELVRVHLSPGEPALLLPQHSTEERGRERKAPVHAHQSPSPAGFCMQGNAFVFAVGQAMNAKQCSWERSSATNTAAGVHCACSVTSEVRPPMVATKYAPTVHSSPFLCTLTHNPSACLSLACRE